MAHCRRITDGTQLEIGAPDRAMAPERVAALSAILAGLDIVVEAHIPQVYSKGVFDPPRPVLFVVFRRTTDIVTGMNIIGPQIDALLGIDGMLEVIPVARGNRMLKAVRKAGCMVGWRDRPWWQFW